MLVNTQNSDFAAAKSSLEGNVTKAMSSSSMKTIQVSDSQTMSLNTVTDTPTVGVCIDGSVYGLNQGLDKTGDHSQRCRKYSKHSIIICFKYVYSLDRGISTGDVS